MVFPPPGKAEGLPLVAMVMGGLGAVSVLLVPCCDSLQAAAGLEETVDDTGELFAVNA